MAEGTGGFINPEQILNQIVKSNSLIVADFGSGHGYFAIPLAKMLIQGKVYACDVIEEALQSVRSKAELENLSNIETIHCNLENPNASRLNDDSMDLVILANILYQSEKKNEIIKEAVRVLKNDGELAVIDWIKGSTLAPKDGWLISKEEIRKILETEKLKLEKELIIDDNQHYGLVFRKK